jgi:hypothetical protein
MQACYPQFEAIQFKFCIILRMVCSIGVLDRKSQKQMVATEVFKAAGFPLPLPFDRG